MPGKLSIAAPVALAPADAIAVHGKNDATGGAARWFVGSYVLGLHRTEKGWRIDCFETG
ncbi:hypothetical protein KHQ06_21310 [Nocardia tengchongensis]|uniref:Nuclear transport factor 2 family protein n=1 Tax=Nocardia tengchongensis TaxID=2055889 RepID=A0ABX8CHM3_9NOCA|nr:hypothetical protein [Nocardia tengchongensis]QVI19019.1 hypothetical protein KHQ06_21310 [Nocardia tengchongensis]